MPLVLQLHTKFGVDTLNTFSVIGYFKVLQEDNDENNDNYDELAITIAHLFLRNR